MTITAQPPEQTDIRPGVSYPLDPLTPDEIAEAVAILKSERGLGKETRFETVTLNEPPKDVALGYKPGDRFDREAFFIVFDNRTSETHEAVVSLTSGRVVSWKHIPGVQPRVTLDEFYECDAAVRAAPEFIEALAKRGITDLDMVMVDPWSAGNFGIPEEEGLRLVFGRCWLRAGPNDNGYARPIEGVIPVVDLNRMEVLRVEDHGIVPLPPNDGNYAAEYIEDFRQDLKPLEITQPQGPSFTVEGNKVSWQKWSMRLGFNPREGLVLYCVGYEDKGRIRPVMYRASLSEMVVPYGDPRPHNFRRNAFDLGEYGIGMLTNSLVLGCDCLGEIYYFDAHLHDTRGNPVTIPNAICMHEEDYGILWKHTDMRTRQVEVRRSRRLVISFITTVGNYEYGFYWYFYQDGGIEYEVKMSGIMHTSAVAPGETPKYGTLVAPQLNGAIHQHFFNVRLDMSVDGDSNSVYEINAVAEPRGPDNPQGNAFYAKKTLLASESEAQRMINPDSARYWLVSNTSESNSLGQPTSYKLTPGDNTHSMLDADASVSRRGAFITKHLWVTPYAPDEKAAAGDYVNQHPGGDGLPAWTQADRSVQDTDVVLWYTFGMTHITRPEDWPVMPVTYSGFTVKPVGFFDVNPALDVPPSAHANGACGGGGPGGCTCHV